MKQYKYITMQRSLDILTIVCKKVLKSFSHWYALILYFSTEQLCLLQSSLFVVDEIETSISQSLTSWQSSPCQTVRVFLFRLPLTKSFDTSPNTLSSLWRRREHQQLKQKKGAKNIHPKMTHGCTDWLTSGLDCWRFCDPMLKNQKWEKVEKFWQRSSNRWSSPNTHFPKTQNRKVCQTKEKMNFSASHQVGEKGKDQMDHSCIENEQWKEVGWTNISY